jgi:hypothetical protein
MDPSPLATHPPQLYRLRAPNSATSPKICRDMVALLLEAGTANSPTLPACWSPRWSRMSACTPPPSTSGWKQSSGMTAYASPCTTTPPTPSLTRRAPAHRQKTDEAYFCSPGSPRTGAWPGPTTVAWAARRSGSSCASHPPTDLRACAAFVCCREQSESKTPLPFGSAASRRNTVESASSTSNSPA